MPNKNPNRSPDPSDEPEGQRRRNLKTPFQRTVGNSMLARNAHNRKYGHGGLNTKGFKGSVQNAAKRRMGGS